MGCDWVYPKRHRPHVPVRGASLYCHLVETANGTTDIKKGDTVFGPSARCTLNNWLEYFSFETHMGRAETSNRTAVIVVSLPTYGPVDSRTWLVLLPITDSGQNQLYLIKATLYLPLPVTQGSGAETYLFLEPRVGKQVMLLYYYFAF